MRTNEPVQHVGRAAMWATAVVLDAVLAILVIFVPMRATIVSFIGGVVAALVCAVVVGAVWEVVVEAKEK